MMRVYLQALGIINALGNDVGSIRTGLSRGFTSGLQMRDDLIPGRTVMVGAVTGALPQLEPQWGIYTSRNNRLLRAAILQIQTQIDTALSRYGTTRIGIVIGTSTSGIAEGEYGLTAHLHDGAFPANYNYLQQEISSPSEYLRNSLGISGPAWTISTACTSSAKAFSSARRLLNAGLCDAVIVGGVDSLCRLTLNGFAALDALSNHICNPFSINRDGITIGEGAALFLISREPGPVCLLGVGESSDAYHISGPDPEGHGAELAMRQALLDAGVSPKAVDYMNLHGTGTIENDLMESHVVGRVLGPMVPCSSTKPLVGHMLGAAGSTEVAFCWMLLTEPTPARFPPHLWDGETDPKLAQLNLCTQDCPPVDCSIAVSNSFAFGGNNACIVLGRG